MAAATRDANGLSACRPHGRAVLEGVRRTWQPRAQTMIENLLGGFHVNGLEMDVAFRSDVGRVRQKNEDDCRVADLEHGAVASPARMPIGERGVLLAVSDGMGGHRAGDVASRLTLDTLLRQLRAGAVRGDDALRDAILAAHREVLRAAEHDPDLDGMGATLVAALVERERATLALVGDSRAYLARGAGVRQLTHDQSVVQALLDQGAISPEEAAHSPYRSVITQAIGTDEEPKPTLQSFAFEAGDVLLLCSDGLSNLVNEDDMQAALADGASLEAAVDRLVAQANERGGDDNITVVAARFSV